MTDGGDRLSALDAAFLRVERAVQPVHVAFLLVLAGPAPGRAELGGLLAERLPLRLRQVVRTSTADLRRPRWVDADIDVDRHLMCHDLSLAAGEAVAGAPAADPAAGGGAGEPRLQAAVSRLLEPPLPRDRPLWDVHVLTGWDAPASGSVSRGPSAAVGPPSGEASPRWAVLVRAHHALVDGLAGVDALLALLDPPGPVDTGGTPGPGPRESGPSRDATGAAGEPAPTPGTGRRVLGAATPLRSVAGVARLASAVGPGERLLSGPLSPRREWSWARGDLATAREVAAELGASVNDVALACVTGGLRELLLSRGTPVAGRTLRALVPVSLRHPGQRGSGGNLVSGVVVRLPVSEPDPVARVRSVHRVLRDAKDGTAALGPVAALGVVERLPEPLAAVLGRAAARSRHGWCATAVTNVPGPAGTRALAGRALLEAFPCIPLGQRMRVTVGILSTGEHLHCGVTTDAVNTPGADVVAGGTEQSWQDLGGMIAR